VKNPIRNETSLVLVVTVVFSAIAIPVLSGFLEPSQPPAVAAVQIGEPASATGDAERGDTEGDAERGDPALRRTESNPQPEPEAKTPGPAGDVKAKRRRSAPRPANPAPSAQSAPSAPAAPADGAAEDDGGED
jgi:hypothetical protein